MGKSSKSGPDRNTEQGNSPIKRVLQAFPDAEPVQGRNDAWLATNPLDGQVFTILHTKTGSVAFESGGEKLAGVVLEELLRCVGMDISNLFPYAVTNTADGGGTDQRDTDPPLKPGIIPCLVNLGDVEPEDVAYLWYPYLPLGKLTILDGDPGLGKTYLALSICSAVSKGADLPGPDGISGNSIKLGKVLYFTAEDGLQDTLVPRLKKMGADCKMVICPTGWKTTANEEEQAFTLRDLNALRGALDRVRPSLIVIDPLQAYIPGIDMNKANESRPLLSGISRLAEDYKCAVLAIRHLNKSGGAKAVYRGLGTIDFSAAARSMILVGVDHKTGKRAMLHTKNSCCETGPTLGFEINEGGFMWTGLSGSTTEDILSSPVANKKAPMDTSLEEAIAFLYDSLRDSPVLVNTIKKEAQSAGLSWRTVERAKEKLQFRAIKIAKEWFWPQLCPPA